MVHWQWLSRSEQEQLNMHPSCRSVRVDQRSALKRKIRSKTIKKSKLRLRLTVEYFSRFGINVRGIFQHVSSVFTEANDVHPTQLFAGLKRSVEYRREITNIRVSNDDWAGIASGRTFWKNKNELEISSKKRNYLKTVPPAWMELNGPVYDAAGLLPYWPMSPSCHGNLRLVNLRMNSKISV